MNNKMLPKAPGKLEASDERMTSLLSWAPWLSFFMVSLPAPIVFLVLFLAAGTTEMSAIYLLLSFVSAGLGLVVGLLVVMMLLVFRRRWHGRFRDRLAADGITAAEVIWFTSELSSEERKIWGELQQKNPLLADAYCETLAARLTATRIIARARGETLRVERQINRTRNIRGVDTTKLLTDLTSDRQRSVELRKEATVRLSETKARLQTIEAAANRSLSQTETDVMLRRLAASQEHFPLALEMANLEEAARREIDTETSLEKPAGFPQPNK
ncbi:MAG TPA: hypothetical protein VGO68_14960 [Pyrinomonadaceae bacterium]|jgi:hypothetical protein|nr:hypothetical protein [Pyrinomonadaceae bacterium]